MKIAKLVFSKLFDDEPIQGTKAQELTVRIITIATFVVLIGQLIRYDLLIKIIFDLLKGIIR